MALISPARPVEGLKTQPYFRALLDELSRRGFVDGENLIVNLYSGRGPDRGAMPNSRELSWILAQTPYSLAGTRWWQDLKPPPPTIPIVATIDDPVAEGLASSLARPGTNLTGVTVDAGLELYGKRLALLLEVRPNVSAVAYLSSHENWNRPTGAALREAAQQAGMALTHVDLGNSFNAATYSAAFSLDGKGSNRRTPDLRRGGSQCECQDADQTCRERSNYNNVSIPRPCRGGWPHGLLYRSARCISLRGRSDR